MSLTVVTGTETVGCNHQSCQTVTYIWTNLKYFCQRPSHFGTGKNSGEDRKFALLFSLTGFFLKRETEPIPVLVTSNIAESAAVIAVPENSSSEQSSPKRLVSTETTPAKHRRKVLVPMTKEQYDAQSDVLENDVEEWM